MCLSIPAKVIRIKDGIADVSVGGTVLKAGLQLVGDVSPGDYVLLHAGFAINKLSLEEAEETLELLNLISNQDPDGQK